MFYSVGIAGGKMSTRFDEIHWSRLEQPNDPLGVSCDEHGPSIGPIRLLKQTSHGFEPRWIPELEFVLSTAFGRPMQLAGKMRGLRAVADALEKGDLARAMLVTQFMWLPSLPDERAFHRAITADTLAKAGFNPDQPRDEQGRWAGDGANGIYPSGFVPVQGIFAPETIIPFLEGVRPVEPLPSTPPFPGEIVPPIVGTPDIALPRTLENPYPNKRGCRQEWEEAKRYCRELADRGLLGAGDYKEHGKYYEQCVRGQVSERCGGNPIA
jgi:hypothetical protein